MVVDDVEDFDVGAACEGPVGGLFLPAFAREIALGRVSLRVVFELLGDEFGTGQDPPDHDR